MFSLSQKNLEPFRFWSVSCSCHFPSGNQTSMVLIDVEHQNSPLSNSLSPPVKWYGSKLGLYGTVVYKSYKITNTNLFSFFFFFFLFFLFFFLLFFFVFFFFLLLLVLVLLVLIVVKTLTIKQKRLRFWASQYPGIQMSSGSFFWWATVAWWLQKSSPKRFLTLLLDVAKPEQ